MGRTFAAPPQLGHLGSPFYHAPQDHLRVSEGGGESGSFASRIQGCVARFPLGIDQKRNSHPTLTPPLSPARPRNAAHPCQMTTTRSRCPPWIHECLRIPFRSRIVPPTKPNIRVINITRLKKTHPRLRAPLRPLPSPTLFHLLLFLKISEHAS